MPTNINWGVLLLQNPCIHFGKNLSSADFLCSKEISTFPRSGIVLIDYFVDFQIGCISIMFCVLFLILVLLNRFIRHNSLLSFKKTALTIRAIQQMLHPRVLY